MVPAASSAQEGPAGEEPGPAAPEVRELRVQGRVGTVTPAMVERFQSRIRDEWGQRVVVRFEEAEAARQFFNASMLRLHDVVNPTQEELKAGRFRYLDRQLALPLDLDNIPNFERLNRCLRHLNALWMEQEIQAMPMTCRPLALAYQIFLDEPPPASWTALWEERYQNRLAVSRNDGKGNVFLAALAAGLMPHEMGDPKKLDDRGVAERLLFLAMNARHFWEGSDTAADFQDCYLATSRGAALAPRVQPALENWGLVDPREGTLAQLPVWMVTKRASSPEQKRLAEAWIDFYLSPEVQLERMRSIGAIPVTEGLADQAEPEEVVRFHLNDPEYFVNQLVVYPGLDEVRDRVVAGMWERALEEAGKL